MITSSLATSVLGYGLYSYAEKKTSIVHDLKYILKSLPMLYEVNSLSANTTVIDQWERVSKSKPNKIALIFTQNGAKFTFKEIDNYSNQIANFLRDIVSLNRDNTIALMMQNRPEYIFIIIAALKLGIKIAFINPNTRHKPLEHAISVVPNCKLLLYGVEVKDNVLSREQYFMTNNIQTMILNDIYCKDDGFFKQVSSFSVSRPPTILRDGLGLDSVYGYIYTSGTTGLPKACIIRHKKLILIRSWAKNMYGLKETDIHYCALPLYHTAGGVLGLAQMICGGLTLVLAPKFSAKQFFTHCKQYNCTVSQYIGEIARYLLSTVETSKDKDHQVRLMFGNGLRREIWVDFVSRFNIEQLGEFYGSTEGNASLCQLYDRKSSPPAAIGACGRAGSILDKALGIAIVKFDYEKEVPKRNKEGYCSRVLSNETGELIGLVSAPGKKQGMPFDGYTNNNASDKKLLRDVFQNGDVYFRTGDLVRRNDEGWVYFVDRVGDTFRWKGENVSTNEVSEVISTFPNILEANVYGVEIPGNDGRACMAALTLKEDVSLDSFPLEEFAKYNNEQLPSYATPKFIRIIPNMVQTGTFKQKKFNLVKEGFDLSKIKDPLFLYNTDNVTYEPLTKEGLLRVVQGQSRL